MKSGLVDKNPGKSLEQTVMAHTTTEIFGLMRYLRSHGEAEMSDQDLYEKKVEQEHKAKQAAQKRK